MKNMKRLISMLTVVCMIFTLFSTVSFAASDDLTLNKIASELARDPGTGAVTGRRFIVSGTYDGYDAGETILISVSKGLENPETILVTDVKTTAGGAFEQAFTIPFAADASYYDRYLVVVNSANGSEPKYETFEMAAMSTTASLKSVSFKNDTDTFRATADEEAKTAYIGEIPYKVNLAALEELVIKADAAKVMLGATELLYDDAKKGFVGTAVDFISGATTVNNTAPESDEVVSISYTQTVTVYPEDPEAAGVAYEITFEQIPAIETAELTDIYLWVKSEAGNLRGFAAETPVLEESGETTVKFKVPTGFDFSKASVTYKTDAIAVYDLNAGFEIPVKRRTGEDDDAASLFDLTKMENPPYDRKVALLQLVAESGATYDWTLAVETTSAKLKEATVGGVAGTISESAKTVKVVVANNVDRTNMALTFDAYDAVATINEAPVASGDLFDFTNPVTLVLQADDGSTHAYTITVSVDPKTIAELKTFTVAGKDATIDHEAKTISVTIPSNASTQFAYTITGKKLQMSTNGSSWVDVTEANKSNGVDFGNYSKLRVLAEDLKTPSDTYTITVTKDTSDIPEKDSTTTQKQDSSAKGDSFVITPQPVVPVPQEPVVNFTDLGTAEWAREAITNLAKKGVVSGRSETIFDPDGLVTREEYAKMLVLAFGLKADGAVCDKFWDVSPTDWYYEYVAIASARGIVNGLDNGSFGVGKTITRQDMAVMTYRAAMATGKAFNYVNAPMTFVDGSAIAAYANEAVTVMQRAGIINGMGGNIFAPNGTATRAQAAKIMDMASK